MFVKNGFCYWDNGLSMKTTEGLRIPTMCGACGAELGIYLEVGVVVKCCGPNRHYFGTIDNPIKSVQGQKMVNVDI